MVHIIKKVNIDFSQLKGFIYGYGIDILNYIKDWNWYIHKKSLFFEVLGDVLACYQGQNRLVNKTRYHSNR